MRTRLTTVTVVMLAILSLVSTDAVAQRRWPRGRRHARPAARLAQPAPRLGVAAAFDTRRGDFGVAGLLDLPVGHYVSLVPAGAYFPNGADNAWQVNLDLIFRLRPRGILTFGGGVAFVKGERWSAAESWRTCPSALLGLQPRAKRPVLPYVRVRWTFDDAPRTTLTAGLSFILR